MAKSGSGKGRPKQRESKVRLNKSAAYRGASLRAQAKDLAHRAAWCACGKKPQPNRKAAAVEAARLRRLAPGEPFDVYRCSHGELHAGHPIGWRAQTLVPRPDRRTLGGGIIPGGLPPGTLAAQARQAALDAEQAP